MPEVNFTAPRPPADPAADAAALAAANAKLPVNVVYAPWVPEDSHWFAHSSHFCAGVARVSRACHFQGLVYDKQDDRFLYLPEPVPEGGYGTYNTAVGGAWYM